MSLTFTRETLRAGYNFLNETPPFSAWNLPDAEDVDFRVIRDPGRFGLYSWNGKRHKISLSALCVGSTAILLEKTAHEMIHLHLQEMGMDSRGNEYTHNAAFRKLAADVCHYHGWDVKAFY